VYSMRSLLLRAAPVVCAVLVIGAAGCGAGDDPSASATSGFKCPIAASAASDAVGRPLVSVDPGELKDTCLFIDRDQVGKALTGVLIARSPLKFAEARRLTEEGVQAGGTTQRLVDRPAWGRDAFMLVDSTNPLQAQAHVERAGQYLIVSVAARVGSHPPSGELEAQAGRIVSLLPG